MRPAILSRQLSSVLLLGVAPVACAAPVITEVLAKNTSGLTDSDGARPDWIEVHNPAATAQDMSGYALTDDPADRKKWLFPAGAAIPPGGYIVVFASGKDRLVAGRPLHTSFSLDADGEYLALFAPSAGAALSEFAPAFAAQQANVSWGMLNADAAAGFGFFKTPTPGAANNPATSPAGLVTFSLTSRTFSTATLQVSLSTASSSAIIRYTTNRSEPTLSSPVYSGTPLSIASSTRLRARAFETGRPEGPVSSETFLKINTAAASFSSTLPIVVTTTWGASVPATDTQVPAHLMIFEPRPESGNSARLTALPRISAPCILERRGSSTAGAEKYSMKLETRDESGGGSALPILGMSRDADWVMHAPYEYDRSLMHNDLIFRISNEAGRYAPRTRFVEHFHDTTSDAGTISGALTGSVDYFGVYSFMEKITRGNDRVDVERLTAAAITLPNVQGGYMFKVDRLDPGDNGIGPLSGQSFGGVGQLGWVYPKERANDPALVVTTAQSNYLRGAVGAYWAALSGQAFMDPQNGYVAHIDVGAAVDHHLLNVAAKNVDALRLSAHWHKPRFGKLTSGPLWDFDRAQGSTDGRDLIPNTWRGDNGDLGTDFFHYPWYTEMFRDPNFWQAWIDRLHDLRRGPLETACVHQVIDSFAAELNPGNTANTPAKRNIARWNSPRGTSASTPGTNGTYSGEVQWLKNWWAARLNFMDGQFTRPPVSGVASGPVPAGTAIALSSLSLSRSGATIYYTTNGTDPRPMATAPLGSGPVVVTQSTLIDEVHPVRAIVPTSVSTSGPSGVEWMTAGFDDSAWFANAAGAINGVGYDDATAAGTVDFLPHIGLRWNSNGATVLPANATNTMRALTTPQLAGNQSCYLRLVFNATAEQRSQISGDNKLLLKLRYDDGFIAWLNGSVDPVAMANQPFTFPAVTYSSAASGVRTDSDAVIYRDFDITAQAGALVTGTNVVAIQGLNAGLASPDFLFQAKLVVSGPLGSVSPVGQTYTAPISVNGPLQITARTFDPASPSDPPSLSSNGPGTVPNGSGWSGPVRLYYFPGAVAASAANLRLSEIHYHPPPPTAAEIGAGFERSNDFEFLRLTNTGSVPVDLTGITFTSGVTFTSAAGLHNWLPAGQSVVIVENTAGFTSRYGDTFTLLGEYTGELDDAGETIELRDKAGALIASVAYDDEAPWPAAADSGHSLVFNGSDPTVPTKWSASIDPGGTGATTYARWAARHFPSQIAPTRAADTDSDGYSNFEEYAFATDPVNLTASRTALLPAGSVRGIAVRHRSATDLVWTLETSTSLTNWLAHPVQPESRNSHPDGTDTSVWLAPVIGGGKQFLRVRATRP